MHDSPIILDELDHLANDSFPGLVVRKDLLRRMRSAFGVPAFVIEFLLGKYCASTDEDTINEGLEFVRERYALSQGDISRGQRQQAFIKAVMQKALSRETLTNPARFASFVDAATTNLTVDDDLDMGEMRSLALAMRNVRGDDIHFVTAPWTGIGSDDWAGSIVNPAWDQVDVLAEHLRSDTMEDYSDPVSPQSGFGG